MTPVSRYRHSVTTDKRDERDEKNSGSPQISGGNVADIFTCVGIYPYLAKSIHFGHR